MDLFDGEDQSSRFRQIKNDQKDDLSDALCYVAFDTCEIYVDKKIQHNFPTRKWFDVDILTDDIERLHQNDDFNALCGTCNLNIATTKHKDYPFELRLIDVPLFEGYECDLIHKSCQRTRSDASLLFGLLRLCSDAVTVSRALVLFQDTGEASLVVYLSFPHFLQGKPGLRYLKKPKNPSEYLPTTCQLLLSIVQSDWYRLDVWMRSREQDLPKRQELIKRCCLSFFPRQISSEELYSRVSASSASLTNYSSSINSSAMIDECFLLQLPKELFVKNIAPYLRARSLNMLRCSCSFLYQLLRAVVPGLKLKLYSHQISSLSWMRERECKALTEKECLDISSSPVSTATSYCPLFPYDTDLHRAATGGRTVVLRTHSWKRCSFVSESFRVDQMTGLETLERDPTSLMRNVAKGGLLCDDPGLGKTITVLSLALQTSGLSTSKDVAKLPLKIVDDDVFNIYWDDHLTKEYRFLILNKLFNRLVRFGKGRGHFFSVHEVRNAIEQDSYCHNFSAFVSDVKAAIDQCCPDDDDERKTIISHLHSHFDEIIHEMKQTQLRSVKKSFSKASARPNSQVATIIEQQRKRKLEDSLVPSGATLLVIPSVLMEHWKNQIEKHIDMSYVTSRIPILFEFRKKVKPFTVEQVSTLCNVKKTHCPVVFFDMDGTKSLPSAHFLAQFCLVITTTQRFKNEFTNGSFQQEMEADDLGEKRKSYQLSEDYIKSGKSCPLLKVHWLRMVVDEGHSMGGCRLNSTIQFASWVGAERRWAMTGTPTKHTVSHISQLHALLMFLRHDFFSSHSGGDKVWRDYVVRPWREGSLVSFFRLRSLLSLLMKRHTKTDIIELTPPNRSTAFLPLSYMESTAYNTLVCGVKSNILITSMEGKSSGAEDSLLHTSQNKHAREALRNIQGVCIGWSRVVPTLQYDYFFETLRKLEEHGIDEEIIANNREYLVRAQEEQLTPCAICSLELSTLLLLPCCGCLICPECMEDISRICLVCDKKFDVDEFQLLQPGFALEWKANLDENRKQSPRSSLFESETGQSERVFSPSNPAPLLDSSLFRPVRRRTAKKGDGHICSYDRLVGDGCCKFCLEEHIACNLMNSDLRCTICYREASECPDDETKAAYLTKKLFDLFNERHCFLKSTNIHQLPGFATKDTRPLKAIIFSQFRKAINFVGDRLLRRFGTSCVAEYWGKHRTIELQKFTVDPDCFCMLLSKDGSEGLDLSFVTHIFFLEHIWDKSLEDQAIARAWRMGARGRVEVETLIAKNSVEETLLGLENTGDRRKEVQKSDLDADLDEVFSSCEEGMGEKEKQQAKTHYLLKSLKFITDYHRFGTSQKMLHNADNLPRGAHDVNAVNVVSSTPSFWAIGKKPLKNGDYDSFNVNTSKTITSTLLPDSNLKKEDDDYSHDVDVAKEIATMAFSCKNGKRSSTEECSIRTKKVRFSLQS